MEFRLFTLVIFGAFTAFFSHLVFSAAIEPSDFDRHEHMQIKIIQDELKLLSGILSIPSFVQAHNCPEMNLAFSKAYYKGFWEHIKTQYERVSKLVTEMKIPESDARFVIFKNTQKEIMELLDFEFKEKPILKTITI